MEIDKPKLQTPSPAPTVNDARNASERSDLLRKRQGRAATHVSDAAGRSAGGTATKMLMGQGG